MQNNLRYEQKKTRSMYISRLMSYGLLLWNSLSLRHSFHPDDTSPPVRETLSRTSRSWTFFHFTSDVPGDPNVNVSRAFRRVAAVTFVAEHRVYYRVRGDPRPLMKRLVSSCQRDVDVTKFAIM